VGNLDTPFSSRHRTSRKNISKNILELNNIVDKMDLTEIYRVFHPMAEDYKFFSAVHGTFSKINPRSESTSQQIQKK
jgi:hypothetical protein